MPVNEVIRGEGCSVHSWSVVESTAELESQCLDNGISAMNNFSLESRYQQFLVTQLLFVTMFPGQKLSYESTGKPITNSNSFVSISHSGKIVVMMKSEIACGVDIERIHPRVEKVKHKYLTDDELLRVQSASTEELVRYWTAKEAMFKVHGSEDVFMRSNIFVENVSSSQADVQLRDGELTLKRTIRFRVDGDMMLAWTEASHGT